MSKKNKKYGRNFFGGLTADEQKKNSEELRRMMDGENIFAKACKANRKKEPLSESGLPRDLEKVIREDYHRRPLTSEEEPRTRIMEDEFVERTGVWSAARVEDEVEEFITVPDTKLSVDAELNHISIRTMEELLKVSVNDGIFDSPISLEIVSDSPIFSERFAPDTIESIKSYLFAEILCNKYPTAIFTIDEFRDPRNRFRFVRREDYNSAKFFFSTNDTYVFAYYIDVNSIRVFENYMRRLGWDDLFQLKAWLAMAVTTSDGNVEFPCSEEDDDSLGLFYQSEWNKKESFVEAFSSDTDTILMENPVRPEDGISITDVDDIRVIAEHLGVWISDTDIDVEEIQGQCLTTDLMKDLDEMDTWLVNQITTAYYYADNEEDDDDDELFDFNSLPFKKVPGTSIPTPVIDPSAIKSMKMKNDTQPIQTAPAQSQPVNSQPLEVNVTNTSYPNPAAETAVNVVKEAVPNSTPEAKPITPIKPMSKSEQEVQEELANFVLNVVHNNRG